MEGAYDLHCGIFGEDRLFQRAKNMDGIRFYRINTKPIPQSNPFYPLVCISEPFVQNTITPSPSYHMDSQRLTENQPSSSRPMLWCTPSSTGPLPIPIWSTLLRLTRILPLAYFLICGGNIKSPLLKPQVSNLKS
jgi:hypothetical protein